MEFINSLNIFILIQILDITAYSMRMVTVSVLKHVTLESVFNLLTVKLSLLDNLFSIAIRRQMWFILKYVFSSF